MWARTRNRRGALTLEAALVGPLLLVLLLAGFLVAARAFVFDWGLAATLGAVRQEVLAWNDRGDGLYWDLAIGRGDRSKEEAKEARIRAVARQRSPLSPDPEISVGLHPFGGGTVRIRLVAPLFSVRDARVCLAAGFCGTPFLPAHALRQRRLVEEHLWPEILKQAGSGGDSDGLLPERVCIVDDTPEEHAYLQVYHLDRECQYVRGRACQSYTADEAIRRGFRPCLVCLRREILQQRGGDLW